MKPEDVPDEALLAALIEYYNDGRESLADFGYGGDDVDAIAGAIAAAANVLLPEHERQVRAKVAEELKALRDGVHRKDKPYNESFVHALDCAIREITRGDRP